MRFSMKFDYVANEKRWKIDHVKQINLASVFFPFLISMRSFRLSIVANDFIEIDLSIWQIIKAKRVTCWIVSTQRSNARLLTMCGSLCQGTKQRPTNWQRYHFRSHRHTESDTVTNRTKKKWRKANRMSDREKKQIKLKKKPRQSSKQIENTCWKVSAKSNVPVFFFSIISFLSISSSSSSDGSSKKSSLRCRVRVYVVWIHFQSHVHQTMFGCCYYCQATTPWT